MGRNELEPAFYIYCARQETCGGSIDISWNRTVTSDS